MPLLKMMTGLWVLILFGSALSYGQSVDSVTDKLAGFPSKIFGRIRSRTAGLDQRLTRQTEKYLQRMARREERIRKKLYRVDSMAAKNLFGNDPGQRYAALALRLKGDTAGANKPVSGVYAPYADSLQGSLSFLEKNPQLLSASGVKQADIGNSLRQVRQLQAKMQDADEIGMFMQQRKAQIGQYLSHYMQVPAGLTDAYNDYSKESYYYGQQIKEYKDMLNDPDKLMPVALRVLNKVPAFGNFMRSNSSLSSLFNLGSSSAGPGTGLGAAQAAGGLATRDQVMAVMQGQMGTGGPNAASLVRQNLGDAQGQLDQLRDKANAGGKGGELDMPEFAPNTQKTKPFLTRLEVGTNLQSAHGSYYFPTTTDIGMTVGYKLDENNRVGVGASYKVGWGNDLSHVNVSSQGAGLRSFLDIRLKKTFFASGGFEYNYQQPFYSLSVVKNLSSWQQSGLIGVSKIISMNTKVFKKTRIQLLWDFLSYQQVPKAQPLKFRIGYNF